MKEGERGKDRMRKGQERKKKKREEERRRKTIPQRCNLIYLSPHGILMSGITTYA